MRIRAGIVLIENNEVALIERHRAGLHYYVFPGGGVDEGETPEQAAVREAKEELGVEVAIRQKLAEVHLGPKSRQVYFLVEYVNGEFGTGDGEEFNSSAPDDPRWGTYHPLWMPIEELSRHERVFPADLAKLVISSLDQGWPDEVLIATEGSN